MTMAPLDPAGADHNLGIHSDNDDGISVIDITEPDHPAYCFLLDEDPLNASEYLQPYDPLPGYRTYLPRGRTIGEGEDDTESESETEDGGYSVLNNVRPRHIGTRFTQLNLCSNVMSSGISDSGCELSRILKACQSSGRLS